MTAVASPIHPFPARMAAHIALDGLAMLPPGAVVLDPMAGSGTVLRAAAQRGLRAVGFDTDPLAVLMARVWTTPIDPDELRRAATTLVERARNLPEDVPLPWLDEDGETRAFVAYWFAPPQRRDVRRLAAALATTEGPIGDAQRVALSRIIVTKSGGASLARDASHSRPHRVRDENDYDVFAGYERSVHAVASRLVGLPVDATVIVDRGDARHLDTLAPASVDVAVTSPPYLNAIDYLRGHRLALVWFGHTISDLRAIRSTNIGSERRHGAAEIQADALAAADQVLGDMADANLRAMVARYAGDLFAVLDQLRRVVRQGGSLTFVVGNSSVRGVFVRNDALVRAAAEHAGLTLQVAKERDLPPNRRYLPPPTQTDSPLAARMRTEVVMTFLNQ